MQLILIRHARPERVEGATGAADPPLTETGHRQAEAMAKWLADETIHALYVSPMLRAKETSTPLEAALGMKATVEPRVREYDHAADSYIPIEELRADRARWMAWLKSERGLDRAAFVADCVAGLTDMVNHHSGQNVAVVCHGGVINAWAADTLGIDNTLFFEPDYTSIHRFMASSRGHRTVVSLNETGHLRDDATLQLR